MDSHRKQLLRVWERLVALAKWSEKHGILLKLLVELLFRLIVWWLEHRKKRYIYGATSLLLPDIPAIGETPAQGKRFHC